MIRAIIVDDEAAAAGSLKSNLDWYCEDMVTLVGEARNLKDAAALLQAAKPDLVFLDINLGEGNGFMLLEKIRREGHGAKVIFTTGHNDYAIQAIKKEAFDYLLKPIDPDELRETVQRLYEKLAQPDSVEEVVPIGNSKTIALPMQDQVLICKLEDLIRCESERNYTRFFLSERKSVLVARTMGQFEEYLLQKNFFRSHKSHIINLAYLESYVRQDGGYLLMRDGHQVPVSRQRKAELFAILGI